MCRLWYFIFNQKIIFICHKIVGDRVLIKINYLYNCNWSLCYFTYDIVRNHTIDDFQWYDTMNKLSTYKAVYNLMIGMIIYLTLIQTEYI